MVAGQSSSEAARKWSNIVFAGLFALSILFFLRIIWPFVLPVLMGAFIAVLFMPMHDWLCRKLDGRPGLCAGLATTGVFLLILVPLAVLAYFLAKEMLGAVDFVRAMLDKTDLRQELARQLPVGIRRYIPLYKLNQQTGDAVMAAMGSSAAFVTNLLSEGTEFAIDLFLIVVAIYYFFLDGRRLVREGMKLIPLDSRYSEAFITEFKDVTYAIMWGNTLTAVVQGAIGTVGLFIAGVPSPLIWGAAMVVVAMIPVGGTALVWVPVSVGLLLTHHVNEGLFLLAWGAFLVSTIDNVVRPRLAGSRMKMHPLLVFLSMFGGLAVVGVMGLVVGPLVAAIVMSMVRIYRRDFLSTVLPGLGGIIESPTDVEPQVEQAPAIH